MTRNDRRQNDRSDNNPENLAVRTMPSRISRINRRLLVSIIGLGLLALTGLALLGLGPLDWRAGRRLDTAIGLEHKPTPDALQRLPATYDRVPAKLPPAPLPPAPEPRPIPSLSPPDPASERAQAEASRRARLAAEARDAPPTFRLTSRAPPPAEALTHPLAADARQSTRLMATLVAPPPLDPTPTPASSPLEAARLAPRRLEQRTSPYQLFAGSLIAANLLTGLNADLPGPVVAQVSENVFDSVSGRFLLIPQGSRLIGRYLPAGAHGQKRIFIAWTRLIRPDGSSLVLDNEAASDSAGYMGLSDVVDTHTGELTKGVLLASVVGIAASLANNRGGDSELVRALKDATQSGTHRAGDRLIDRGLDLKPTLTVRPGWPLRVILTRDLLLAPYPSDHTRN